MKKNKFIFTLIGATALLLTPQFFETNADANKTTEIKAKMEEAKTELTNKDKYVSDINSKLTNQKNQATNVEQEISNLKIKVESQSELLADDYNKLAILRNEALEDQYSKMVGNLKTLLTGKDNLYAKESLDLDLTVTSVYNRYNLLASEVSTKRYGVVELEKTLTSKSEALSEIQTSISDLESEKNTQVTLQKQLLSQVENYEVELSKSADYQREQVVQYALDYVGVPYLWGGTTPSGFDCSGLMMYAYNKADITIPRVSYVQAQFGVPVSWNNFKPGDLIFFDTMKLGRVSHVGMYIGNGKMVHAPAPGKDVQIVTLTNGWKSVYKGARRIIN